MNIYAAYNDTFYQSYLTLMKDLMKSGYEKSPRGQKVKYFQNYLFHVEHPGDVFSCETRKYPTKYLNDELKLYFSGELSAEKFGEASKFWLKLANPDGTINSNYGYLIFYKEIANKFEYGDNQWDWALSSLLDDKDSRQAIMFLSSPHVQFCDNKDFICTLNYTFSINDNVLNFEVNRRSQDIILGLTFDYAWEYLLMEKMYDQLKSYYPDLQLGSYTMFCNNIHVYERNFDTVNKMIEDAENGRAEQLKIKDIVDPVILNTYVYSHPEFKTVKYEF